MCNGCCEDLMCIWIKMVLDWCEQIQKKTSYTLINLKPPFFSPLSLSMSILIENIETGSVNFCNLDNFLVVTQVENCSS